MCGQSERVSKKWMQPYITKTLIHVCWKLNQLIDAGKGKPPGMEQEVWDELKEARGSEAAQQKSAHMHSISKGKGSLTAEAKAIEREVVSRLVSFKGLDYCPFLMVHVNFSTCYL